VFLQAIGRYLDDRITAGSLDEMYAYAQHSLLHYARWMAEHEYFYLDKPNLLEYPTETWAAQDMRKSDVFKFAARHADGSEREVFLARSHDFFYGSLERLKGYPTRFTARCRVILMGCGFMHAAFQQGVAGAPAPRARLSHLPPMESFVWQKAAVKQRLQRAAIAGVAVALLGAAVLVFG
jgi:hypothetical protein